MKSAQLIHLLYQTTRAISQGVNQALAEYGLYSSEWSMLVALKEIGSISQVELAHYLNVEPAGISKTIVKLEEKGLAERVAGADKREKKVSLTQKAIEEYAIWERAVDDHRRSILKDLSESRQADLAAMLHSIYSNSQKKKS